MLLFITLSVYAIEPFQEQTPLKMAIPNINHEKQTKWIPFTSNLQETPIKNTIISGKSIDDSIKNQIQKKMQALLKPLKDDENE